MLTTEQIREYLTHRIAEEFLHGSRMELRHIQMTAGYLKAAAESVGDKDAAHHFRVLAAEAANKEEELEGMDADSVASSIPKIL